MTNRAPRTRDPSKLDGYGFRKGSNKSIAAAMYSNGATLDEVKAKVGTVQFNVLTELQALGYKLKRTEIKLPGGKVVNRYRISK